MHNATKKRIDTVGEPMFLAQHFHEVDVKSSFSLACLASEDDSVSSPNKTLRPPV